MKIHNIVVGSIKIPLKKSYVSALRVVESIEDVVIIISTENNLHGYGSAAATPTITGDTKESIVYAISNILAPSLIGKDLTEFHNLLDIVHKSLAKNTSAKAAVDIALHDLFVKRCNLPLYQFFGSKEREITTAMTVGLATTLEMVNEAKIFVASGIKNLKIKAGINVVDDLAHIQAIRYALGDDIHLCVDANQGWSVKEALKIIRMFEKLNLNIEIIEQPITANDLSGLSFLRNNTESEIFADESCFSLKDAAKIVYCNIADGIVIKLMKAGGFYHANSIYTLANSHNISCMAGCMLESPIGIGAMASFSAGKKGFNFVDLGTMNRIKHNPIIGGIKFENNKLIFSDKPGLGIDHLGEFQILKKIQL
jgi:L-Ala-D/L-Glu epimerase / N-acetyl-D-glutamate racemase